MRRTLIVFFVIALCAVTRFASADVWTPTSGITLTEKEGNATLGSRIDAFNDSRLIGSWFSSTSQLPQLVTGLHYTVFADFSGIKKVEKVELSPDHGKTCWKAALVPGRGYCVDLPDLEPGSYGIEWGVTSRDQHNRLMLIIIPINWSSSRSTSVTSQLMVQQAPAGSESYDCQTWFSCLRGFVPAVAEPDPAVIARSQAVRQMMAPPVQPAPPPPVVQTPPPPTPRCEPRGEREERNEPEVSVRRQRPEPNFIGTPEDPVRIFLGHWNGNKFQCDQKLKSMKNFRAEIRVGTMLRFLYCGNKDVEAEVSEMNLGEKTVKAVVTYGSRVHDGADVIVIHGGSR